ncbi:MULTISPECIES: DUF5707 domain-containing protein [unclassified Streptomyces]|uniref:DUF5707 domain-containing protein n=1 Tax=unclassified Streptomyces TaxID=2593676 RepID=UPI00081EA412|nr:MULTISPECIES: DUF5707 domain-containing protein [unclassified Streptomyces]MYZ37587.1 calcium-binding protein [Streptomyces sp. SID4917]SCF92488.1 hypothetical protein GA0115259_104922 [Streptomyces sp. MnatMP-M17]
MRIRATVAAVSGALALSALAVPASQAADGHRDAPTPGKYGFSARERTAAPQAGQRALAKAAAVAPTLGKIVVNGGKPIVVGSTNAQKVTVAITASDDSGIVDASTILWFGDAIEDGSGYAFYQNEEAATCRPAGATTSTCTLTVTVDSKELINTDARTWKVGAFALAYDGEYIQKDAYSTVKIQRQSKLTVNAAPEPVKKGGTITITGSLTRADWDKNKYVGFGTQSVVLQFRKKSSTAYTNVKGVKSSSTGALKTTVKASEDGYYRWNYLGIASTAPVAVAGDYIDVK